MTEYFPYIAVGCVSARKGLSLRTAHPDTNA